MIGRPRAFTLTATALVIALLAAGCGGASVNALPQQPGLPAIKADPANAPVGAAAGVNVFGLSQKRIRFFVITHGQASDPFWAVVQNGAAAAASQLGVSVTYEAPDTYDIARMAEMIRNAATTRPAGLVVSLPNPNALAPAIRAAEHAGIPVVSINSGSDAFRRLGTLLHVGEDEYSAGYAAGRRMSARHVRHALCVIHEAGNLDLERRCRGFAAALAITGGRTSMLDVNLQQTNSAEQRIAAALRGGRFDGLLTLGGAVIAQPTLGALRSDHLLGKITYATFGIGPQVLDAVRAGQISFAVDQQPYLQGYLPIVLLTEYHLDGILPDRGQLLTTGPVFITRQNATQVLELVNQGVR
jgi:simple sugar transport system substrate-binding protein